MPIRTHRGRAAVYRRLWGWPLRSPKHLVFAAILFAALATGIGLILPSPPPASNDTGASYQYQPPGSASPQTTTAAPPSFSVPMSAPPSAPPSPDGLAVVDAWAKQWVNHPPGTTKQQWLERQGPYVGDEFRTQLTSIDPANVPNAITGGVRVLESTATAMQVVLPTDAGDVHVWVVSTPQGWRIWKDDKV